LMLNRFILAQTTAPSTWPPATGSIESIQGKDIELLVNLPDGSFQVGHIMTDQQTKVLLTKKLLPQTPACQKNPLWTHCNRA
jgi:hypothetical protein